jgi:hypothetical protein
MTTTPKVWRATQQANFTDAGDQSDPHIVDIGSGRYVVVWTEAAGGPIATAAGSDLVGQIFDARGNRIGTEFRANVSFFADNEQNAALDTRPSGGFVMVYTDTDAAGTSIRAQSYDVNGSLVGGAPTTIQADTSTDTLSGPAVAVRSNGSYLVTYGRTRKPAVRLARVPSAASSAPPARSAPNLQSRTPPWSALLSTRMSTSSATATTSSYMNTNPALAPSPRLTKSAIRQELSSGVATSAARSRSTCMWRR